MVSIDFDIDRYLRVSNRVETNDIDWSKVREHPLTDADIRVLSYMMDTEYHTVLYLRELLQTSCSIDPDVTAFMSCWNFEELWHGEALARFLREYGVPGVDQRTVNLRKANRLRFALDQMKFLAYSTFVYDFVAISMTWGALNELTACYAYKRLMEQSGHPVLQQLLPRLIKQERRHFAFYFGQAKKRMARRPYVPWMVREVVDHVWKPVGSGLVDEREVDFVMLYLFDSPEGRLALTEIDEQFCGLPGMTDANPLRRFHAAAARRWEGKQPARHVVPPRSLEPLSAVL